MSDIKRIVVRTNWTNAFSERHELLLPKLADPVRLALLKGMFSDPDRLRPGEFAELAGRLRTCGHDAMDVAHFVNMLEDDDPGQRRRSPW